MAAVEEAVTALGPPPTNAPPTPVCPVNTFPVHTFQCFVNILFFPFPPPFFFGAVRVHFYNFRNKRIHSFFSRNNSPIYKLVWQKFNLLFLWSDVQTAPFPGCPPSNRLLVVSGRRPGRAVRYRTPPPPRGTPPPRSPGKNPCSRPTVKPEDSDNPSP